MSAHMNLNLFEEEKNLIKEAERIISQSKIDTGYIIDKFSEVLQQFNKMVKDSEKIIKISDGQHEYLHKIQSDLKKEIEDRIRAEEKLKYLAAIDTLTGVYNRGMGLTLLENELNAIRRNKSIFSMCYIDVNKLKYVNDTFGHFEGDELLVSVCRYIKEVIRANDVLCRLGGDEFIIIFPNECRADAEKKLEQIIERINGENQNNIKPYDISFSYGIIEVSWDEERGIDEIVQMADAKMYEDKQRFNNR